MTWSEIFSIGANIAAIIGVLLVLTGLPFFWQRFLRQKRIENANENSWKVLELLDVAEESINSLFWRFKASKPDGEQFEFQKNVFASVKKLRTGLMVLHGTAPGIADHLKWLESAIKAHEARMRAVRNNEMRAYRASIDLLEDLATGSYVSREPNLVKFEELRQLITSIAGLVFLHQSWFSRLRLPKFSRRQKHDRQVHDNRAVNLRLQ